jgi:colanic acid/amylovoran biosynthesis glycosyltransferase
MNEVRSLFAHFGIEGRFKLLGFLDTVWLTRESAGFARLMLPSYHVNAPIVVREAVAAGTPVIANGVGMIPFQAEDCRTAFLSLPGAFAALPSNPDELISSMEFRDRLRSAAVYAMLAKFRVACAAAKTVGLFRHVLGVGMGGQRETA